MLIHWGWDENFDRLSKSDDFTVHVSELLRAHRRGQHLVAIERKVVKELECLDLSAADKAILRRIALEFTQTGALHRLSTVYVRISNDAMFKPTRVGSALILPFGLIVGSRVLDPPVLLVENLDSDGWLLSIILRGVAERAQRGVIAFEAYHGGGDDLPKVFAHLIRSGRAVYAVVDSDRDAPIGPSGTKMNKLRRLLNATSWVAAEAAALPCREAENLIPRTIVVQVPSARGRSLNSVSLNIEAAEAALGNLPSDRFWSYVDLKNGLDTAKLSTLEVASRDWISEKLGHANLDLEDFCLEGYGGSVVGQVEASGSLAGKLRGAIRETAWRDAFAHFFDPIAWFFLSTQRTVT
jgi:hypothetical protein